MRQVFNALLGAVGAVNINAAIGIGDRSLFQCRNPFLFIGAGTKGDGVLYCSIAFSETLEPAQRTSDLSALLRDLGGRKIFAHGIQHPVDKLH
jgi:hypothetical protein